MDLIGILTLTVFALLQNTSQERREAPEVRYVSRVLDDVQHTWDRLLPAQEHLPYRHAKLVLFRNASPSGCGRARTATGPFYCPEDEKVYLDLAFFDELRTKFGAPGEFAQAYVIAHELGHHVQKLLGIEQKVQTLQQREPGEVNPLSVKLELQADCFAGVWARTTEERNLVHASDIEAAMRAAAAVGDDRLQRMGRGVCQSRDVHARQLGSKSGMVPARTGFRQNRRLHNI